MVEFMDTPQPQSDSVLPTDGGVGTGESTPVVSDLGKGRFSTEDTKDRLTAIHEEFERSCILDGEEMPVDVPQNELDKGQLGKLADEEMHVNVPLDGGSTSEGEDTSHLSTEDEDNTLSGGESVVFSVDCCPGCCGTIKFIQLKGKFTSLLLSRSITSDDQPPVPRTQIFPIYRESRVICSVLSIL